MKTIRASEISEFLYCRRAWWYKQQGHAPANQQALQAGSAYHQRHGWRTALASGLKRIAWTALTLAVLWLLWEGLLA